MRQWRAGRRRLWDIFPPIHRACRFRHRRERHRATRCSRPETSCPDQQLCGVKGIPGNQQLHVLAVTNVRPDDDPFRAAGRRSLRHSSFSWRTPTTEHRLRYACSDPTLRSVQWLGATDNPELLSSTRLASRGLGRLAVLLVAGAFSRALQRLKPRSCSRKRNLSQGLQE